ncbi:MAG: DUF4157 domain-containing protein [Betaproteobacteria bacterium]|nr:DUF4157 domain-containing protein [Betaproteobacteria bacterium]MDH5576885.1 DUF4157 domain-containing protein [Betaproteobacteria bacterium]
MRTAAQRLVNRPPQTLPAAQAVRAANAGSHALPGPAEQEAESVARNVVRLPVPASAVPRPAPELLAGAPLPPDVRRFMEPRLGADLSVVRVHTDERAAQLSRQLNARAFTVGNEVFFGRDRFRPETGEGRELIAHELTHTLQQTNGPARVQRLGLDDVLDGLAELAANVPGFTLLTLIIGRNPINLRPVERTLINLLRGFIGLIPGGELLYQVLERYGVTQRIAAWVSEQVDAMGITFQGLRDSFTRFTDSLGWSDIFSPGQVWRRAQDIFMPTIRRVTAFVSQLASQAITWLKETFTEPLANFCREIPGYALIAVQLGRDPFTQSPVARTAMNVVRAVAEFIPSGREKVDQLAQSGALERAYNWFMEETRARNLTWNRVTGTFAAAWNALRLEDVLHPIDTLRRMVGIFRPLLVDLAGFARAALMQLAEFIFEAAMGAGGARIVAIFRRARGAFNTIIADPVGFLRNLLTAVGQGVRQFMTNILTHLRDGVIAWLAGPVAQAGVQMPERWDLRGIIWFVLQILGLTWIRIRQKLVRLMGERPVAMLEAGFQLIQEIRERGLVQALRDRVTEFFGSLREAALGAIRSFIQQRLVMAGITQLISMLNPVGAVIQAIIKTYTTIQFFIQRINQILDLVESIVNSIAAIAAGAMASAANFIERTMARTIPVILDFLARFIGLGDVAGQVQTAIRNLQARVDQMLDRAVDWIRRQASSLASRALGGDPTAPPAQRLQNGLREGVAAVNRLSGSRIGIALIRPLLGAIRLRHHMQSLEAIAIGGRWVIRGVVNPTADSQTEKQADEGNVDDWPTGSAVDPIPIKWFKPRDGFYPTIRIRGGAERTPRQGILLPEIDRTAARNLVVLNENFMAVDDKIRRRPRGSENVKNQIRAHLDKLLELSPSHADRIFFDDSGGYAVDHIRDLTWSGADDDGNLWPLASAKNNAINASHNQRVRVKVDSRTIRTAAASQFGDKWFRIKQIATSAPSSAGDHGTDNDNPINSGVGAIPKRSP